METVANCVIPYVHDRDRNLVSLVCRRCPWIQEISASFKCLKSLHIRNVAIHDSDLELLSRTRGKDLKVLKIIECEGISENGLMHISKRCNELRLCLDDLDLDGEEGCVKWLQELALRNAGIETFSFRHFCDRLDIKDVALLLKNCSKSLVSLNVNTRYIDDLADAFNHADRLQDFSGAYSREDMEYGSFKFPSTIHCLELYNFRQTSLPFLYPLLNQLRELDLTCLNVKADCECFFIQRCPNLEVLNTDDVCGDKGLQVISQFCKKLRKLRFRYCSGTQMTQGCRNLEFLHLKLTDISNEASECIGINLKNLRVLYLRVRKHKYDIETDLPIDDGIRAMLIGCTKLERLSIDLDEEILTDVGGSDEGVRALSMGCPRLRKLELEGGDFSDQAVASYHYNNCAI
ncbi:hypothetical protein Tco_0397265 [Tanacetum coccineum]